ncbi:ABC transporter ATP-binding protein [Pseudoduganella sp. SL102]|uniref:ABC transporter n=1 Tax=Pseudoduganella albidiflava TaxID=321983 RepID=A0A411WX80_9BURK|nr:MULTISPECIES: ABC transporter ATP-binding protein [Pseudoduganella]QBI01117.1 ABC transporter ATP-binding protein [Pseudoduganella albidiflava]WBS00772.1 ABC transporter ATP-binding protein [Pseudoduganella sp. SL102]GGY48279.1 ABC transporter [Pseudoduganella albidiflava]
MNTSVVAMEGVARSFGGRGVLAGIDWHIGSGAVIGLLGRNGAGKSTLIECLLGLREVDSGAITLFGEPAGNLSPATRARIGYVPQKSELFDWLTPDQLLAYFRTLYPRWNDYKVENLLARWGFDPATRRQRIASLSGGQQQRLSIIRALAPDPDLLVLDEPVASLDPVGRRDFLRELVDDVIERGTTVLFSTHILSDLERIAVDVAFLKDGRIALQAPLDDLLEGTRRVSGDPKALATLRLDQELGRVRHGNGAFSIVARLSAQESIRLLASPGVRLEPVSLEDLFEEVTR